MGDASGRTMTIAVSPPRHTEKRWHAPAGRSCGHLLAAYVSGFIGAYLASPDPDRNMVKSSVTIDLRQLTPTLDY
jgi:hypothetical protein